VFVKNKFGIEILEKERERTYLFWGDQWWVQRKSAHDRRRSRARATGHASVAEHIRQSSVHTVCTCADAVL